MKNNKTIQPQEDILKISSLHKRYNEGKSNEVHALQGVDLTVKKGAMMAIMGASGCGKTTLLNMIGNLDRRSQGQIIIDGVDTSKLSDVEKTTFRRDKIGFIFQLFNLFPFLSAVTAARPKLWISKRASKNDAARTRYG
jgi:putative ABC transport system ATP-binding protein